MQIAAKNIIISKSRDYWGLTFTAEQAGSTISMTKAGDAPAVSLETSTDNGRTWTPFIVGETTITLANVGDSVCFRAGNGGTGGDGLNVAMANSHIDKYNKFVIRKRVAASGDISSIINRRGSVLDLTGRNYCFTNLFNGCTSLTTAPELPATTLADSCYEYMFYNCTSLISVPRLPAMTMIGICYSYMFYNCTSLTTAPELPATTLAYNCYASMFQGCTSLTTAPELPVTTLADYCFVGMFRGCTSLTTAPELPATTLTNHCYASMFQGCTSLTTAPELPATKLAASCYLDMFQGCTSLVSAPELPAMKLTNYCYRSMFQGCTSLTTAPELPATTLANYCYGYMFYNCTLLTHVKVHFTTWDIANATSDWLSSVASSGTFECPTELGTNETIQRGTSYCPNGWSVVNV